MWRGRGWSVRTRHSTSNSPLGLLPFHQSQPSPERCLQFTPDFIRVVFEDQLGGLILVSTHRQVEQIVGDAHHPHEDGDDGGEYEVFQVLLIRVQLHVDYVMCDH